MPTLYGVSLSPFVRKVQILHDELGHGALAQCVVQRAQRLRFPRPKLGGEVDVTFPIHFSPSAGQ